MPAVLLRIAIFSFHCHSGAVLSACPVSSQDLHGCLGWLEEVRVLLDGQVGPAHGVNAGTDLDALMRLENEEFGVPYRLGALK